MILILKTDGNSRDSEPRRFEPNSGDTILPHSNYDEQIVYLSYQLQQANDQVNALSHEILEIKKSVLWQIIMAFHNGFIERVFPQKSSRRRYYDRGLRRLRIFANEGAKGFWQKFQNYACNKKIDIKDSEVEHANRSQLVDGNLVHQNISNHMQDSFYDKEITLNSEKQAVRQAVNRNINFVTCQDLVSWTLEWIRTIPIDYDIVVAKPRSGMLVGTIIAIIHGKPLSTPELIIRGEYWISKQIELNEMQVKKVLLIDDSVASGRHISESKKILCSLNNVDVTTASLIVTPEGKKFVDLYYKEIPSPYHFEWSLVHQRGNGLGKIAMDMDGVLCEDCPANVDNDENKYIEWLIKAKPILIPTYEIDIIVSNRLECYRDLTEQWLARNNIHYGKLYLWKIKSKQERGTIENWTEHKIQVLLEEMPNVMYESDLDQAQRIWKATRIPVLWFTGKRIIQE